MTPIRTLIMGAAGRDFHNFNVFFRGNGDYQVIAFTATQIPNIEGRNYPPELSGPNYPAGIPIYPEDELLSLIKANEIDQVIFAYSDVPHTYVMEKASAVLAAGADFRLMGLRNTQLKSSKPVVSVGAVRTGAGKSQTTRKVSLILREMGFQVAIIRHPMPYGDLAKQAVQRYASYADLDAQQTTIEEREEYEPHLDNGMVVYAGVDYEQILRQAEGEADVILWDGGNNDLPFYQSDLHIVVADPHRPGHETSYHPGEANVYAADVFVINKVDTADYEDVIQVRENLRRLNPGAVVMEAASPLFVDDPAAILGKRVLVVEDGPTLTHGEMAYGAGWVAARRFGAAGDYRSATLCGRLHPENLSEVSEHRERAPSNGVRRDYGGRTGAHHQRYKGRPGDHRHTYRPHPADENQPTRPAGSVRASGDRPADVRRYP